MRKLTGFDVLLRKLSGLFNERAMRLGFLASGVRVSDRQFPQINDMVRDGAYILDLPQIPDVFITQNPLVNAMTLGSDRPFIVITTGLVDLLDPEELRTVVGHELGHVLSGHAVYRTMLYNLILLAQRIAWMPIGYLGLRAIILGPGGVVPQVRAVLRPGGPAGRPGRGRGPAGADEAGRRNPHVGAQPGRFPASRRTSTTRSPTSATGCSRCMQLQGNTHPFAVVRFAELDRWARSGEYERILAGDYPRREDDSTTTIADEVRAAAKSYQESWNRTEDPLIGMVRGAAEGAMRAGEGLFGRFGRRDSNGGED